MSRTKAPMTIAQPDIASDTATATARKITSKALHGPLWRRHSRAIHGIGATDKTNTAAQRIAKTPPAVFAQYRTRHAKALIAAPRGRAHSFEFFFGVFFTPGPFSAQSILKRSRSPFEQRLLGIARLLFSANSLVVRRASLDARAAIDDRGFWRLFFRRGLFGLAFRRAKQRHRDVVDAASLVGHRHRFLANGRGGSARARAALRVVERREHHRGLVKVIPQTIRAQQKLFARLQARDGRARLHVMVEHPQALRERVGILIAHGVARVHAALDGAGQPRIVFGERARARRPNRVGAAVAGPTQSHLRPDHARAHDGGLRLGLARLFLRDRARRGFHRRVGLQNGARQFVAGVFLQRGRENDGQCGLGAARARDARILRVGDAIAHDDREAAFEDSDREGVLVFMVPAADVARRAKSPAERLLALVWGRFKDPSRAAIEAKSRLVSAFGGSAFRTGWRRGSRHRLQMLF